MGNFKKKHERWHIFCDKIYIFVIKYIIKSQKKYIFSLKIKEDFSCTLYLTIISMLFINN